MASRISVITLLATHWLKTFDAYSAKPLNKKTVSNKIGIFNGLTSDDWEKFSSINGFNNAGTSGSKTATAIIANIEQNKPDLYCRA